MDKLKDNELGNKLKEIYSCYISYPMKELKSSNGGFVTASSQSEYQWVLPPKQKEEILIKRDKKISDLITIELVKLKLHNFKKFEELDFIELGSYDFIDLIQEENFGKISEFLYKKELTFGKYLVKLNENCKRKLEIKFKINYFDFEGKEWSKIIQEYDKFYKTYMGTNYYKVNYE